MTVEVIVGCGASALTHLYYAMKSSFTKADTKCFVIGKSDLWTKLARTDAKHPFGQPPQIVHLDGKKPTVDEPSFQNASDISGQLKDMRAYLEERGVTFISDRVINVDRAGQQMSVRTEKSGTLMADRVFIATGFGRSMLPPSRYPDDVKQALKRDGESGKISGTGLFQNRIIGATEYLYSKSIKPPPPQYAYRVAVQGASATSAWAVARAVALAKLNGNPKVQITWITRSSFAEANPAGRNNKILAKASKHGWLTKAGVTEIIQPPLATQFIQVVLGPVTGGREPRPGKLSDLAETYKKYYANHTGVRRMANMILQVNEIQHSTRIYVDHFVYALGGDPSLPGGAGDIIAAGLQPELQPVLDMDMRFDDDPAATTLAFKTEDGRLWLVGATVFRGGGIAKLRDDGNKFTTIGGMMSEAGSPPEGIAAIIAAAKAITGWSDSDIATINLHTADFKELEQWFGKLYLKKTGAAPNPKTARAMADQIVAMRKHSVFGLTPAEIDNLAEPDHAFWNDLFKEEGGMLVVDRLAAFAA